MFLRILGQHFHFNFHPIQAILRQISVFIKCSKHLQCFCVEIPRRINFDNQKIFFSIFFSKTAWISLKSLPKQPIATFRLKSRLPYNTTYGRATQAVSAHCPIGQCQETAADFHLAYGLWRFMAFRFTAYGKISGLR